MSGSHSHAPTSHGRAFALGVTLNLAFVAVEALYGFISGSLALLADAGHNLSDVLGLVLAWGASILARRAATERRSYGLRGASILAALFNALILLVAVGAIGWEAIRRFGEPAPVASLTVMSVAGIGVVINTATALLFWKGRKNDLNVQGAFLHMAADAGVSLAVVLSGALIYFTGQAWLDPVVTLGIALLILVSTWRLLVDSVNLALQAVPANIDLSAVRNLMTQAPGVASVHDLHVWALSTTESALTAHLVVEAPSGDEALVPSLKARLHDTFGIEHVTLQLEPALAATCHPCGPGDTRHAACA
ncbi:cation diffusion facilitator family transporter [Myxococcus sp. K38C18041901]|uniref:cation diffusion facilitator family transporter n=1 Tax=Myxococcus guangdongensis TaxID=2906760 RepID=UPI0020A6DCC8|nr:cation diffusion facilitator family transporter [Myxococcus guangdongensis]MCP3062176.1 cation diffusion facilitator family transporter [Myxococcus guangdongensis]